VTDWLRPPGGSAGDLAPHDPAARSQTPAILLTGVGKRYDIVSCFAALTTTVAADPNPLAPAQYAAQVRAAVPPIDDPGYVPALVELCERHGVGAVIPLTDLDIETLAQARASQTPPTLPALTPSPEVARATYDKYETHLLLERLGLPSPPTVLPDREPDSYPVMVKPRRGSGARSIHLARDAAEKDFFVRYVAEPRPGYDSEPVMVQRAMGGPELSIDCLGDLEGRCLNAIPRTMLESRGGESIKGTVVRDDELIELGRRVMEALAGPPRSSSSATPTSGWGSPTSTPASAGPSPRPPTPRWRGAPTPS
jgi:carbamoyl-phosphate synthase large subunit